MRSDRYRFLEDQTAVPVYILAALLVFTIFYCLDPFLASKTRLFWRIHSAAQGWLSPTYLSTLSLFLPAFLLFHLGKARLKPIGWTKNNLLKALVAGGIIWFASQLLLILTVLFSGQNLTLGANWENPISQIHGFITFFLGIALSEEFLFRAFLFPQIYLFLRQNKDHLPPKALFIAMFVSQTVFGLSHFQTYSQRGAFGGDPILILLFSLGLSLAGVFFAMLYLHTKNVFLLVTLHGLLDHPMAIIESTLPAPALVFLASLLLFLPPMRRFFLPRQDLFRTDRNSINVSSIQP
jgi:membrane protease YdiL (CAAX protease family)